MVYVRVGYFWHNYILNESGIGTAYTTLGSSPSTLFGFLPSGAELEISFNGIV